MTLGIGPMEEVTEEEIAKDIYIHHFDDDVDYPDVLKAITVGVQRGVEFGYNRCFQQVKKLVDDSTRLDSIIPELLRLKECDND